MYSIHAHTPLPFKRAIYGRNDPYERNEFTDILINEEWRRKIYKQVNLHPFIYHSNESYERERRRTTTKKSNSINVYDSFIAFCSLVDSFLQPLYVKQYITYISFHFHMVSDTRNIYPYNEIMMLNWLTIEEKKKQHTISRWKIKKRKRKEERLML